jgi:hypothetical protein
MHSGNSVEGCLPVKRLFLTGVAVLFLATGAAHADVKTDIDGYPKPVRKWIAHIHSCSIYRPATEGNIDATDVIEWDEIPEVLRALRELKQCAAFHQCISDRNAGKVKHCYENDRRWR